MLRAKAMYRLILSGVRAKTVGVAAGFIVTERAAQVYFVNGIAGRAIALSWRRAQ